MSQNTGAFGLCIRCTRSLLAASKQPSTSRVFTSSAARHTDSEEQSVSNERSAGSARRRAALESTSNIPFTQLPYQCFQEALSVLREDRVEKVASIEEQRKRIARLEQKVETASGMDKSNAMRSLSSSRKHLEWLKVQADINDPVVKRRFEDGLADMGKPVYRHLARQKWEGYERKIVMQRVTQMHVIPDVMPKVEPTIQAGLSFGGKRAAHGVVVPSVLSERAPVLHIQSFDAGEKLVTIAVIDSDVPNTKTDAFDHRLHALLTNVTVTPTNGRIRLHLPADKASLVIPWLPPTAQKGAPWHRLSVWVLQHPDNQPIDADSIKKGFGREKFNLRKFEAIYLAKPIGVTMFRTKWDEGMKGVMERHGIDGADVEYKKKPIVPMRYKKKDGARYR